MFILLCFQSILCSQNNNNMRKPTPYDLSAYLYQQSLTPQTQLPDTSLHTPALPPTTEVPPQFQQTFVFPSTTYAGAGSLVGPFSQTPMLTTPGPQLYQQPTISPNPLDGNTFIQGDQACAFYDGQPCFDSSAGLPRPRARVTRGTRAVTPAHFVQEDSPLPMDYMDYRDCMQPGPSTSGIQPTNIPQNIIDEESYLDSDDDPNAEYEMFPFKSHDPSKYIDRPGLILQPETQVYETADEYPDNSYKHLYDSDNFKFDISGNSYNVNLGVRGFPEEYIPFQPPETLSIVNDKKYRDLIRKVKKDAVEIDGSTLYGHDEFIEKEGSADTKDLMNHVECLIESNADSSYAKSLAMRIELKQAVKAKNIKRETI
ncbi:hypothetical protein SLOPH_824 [Spraguea lophii 42_110]|uniref:Uncharacterized protein n=1 Tax=Spraguea lophii (strain 42_110) TaxID=1358809 RepID=S7W8U4_SPRLO|nr:hypothetical protein SLOPH_824 [Spraguea lophii 42_110]